MDKIIIKGLKLFARHGVNPEEKENGQHFILDVICCRDLRKAGETDDLSDTDSYAAIVKTLRAVFCEKSYDLLERAAAVCCQAVLDTYPAIEEVTLTLKKPEAPVKADFEYMAVQITRRRET